MKTVQILESSDTIFPTDWCRPLCITSMSGDFYSFKSQYSGVPENNAMWVRCTYNQNGECLTENT